MRGLLYCLVWSVCAVGCGDSPDRVAPTVEAYVTVVDLGGKPLPGMRPIATLQPNAFDQPVVEGDLTNDSGEGALALPRAQYLYVRAWDPALRYFATNYFDVPPSTTGEATETMVVTMAEGSALRATFVRPDGSPLDHLPVDLMLSHPDHGPWWPDRAVTDEKGLAVFPSVPPGEYRVRLEAATIGRTEIDSVTLSSASETDLGTLTLRADAPAIPSE